MRIAVDQDKCVGSGQCVLAVEEVFDQREEDGIVVLLDAQPSDELVPDVQQAAFVCPGRAITVSP
ncbi:MULTISPECIES: ferredoxin [Streptomyces]|uniref:Ferredoxin n=1 Tax=Streptomyces doebereineriae TaxID=3075528 RepID=A0ABU2VK12_9ACTN|nr:MULTISPECIES: ferredoxin [Streptomyces]MCX5257847.1 ferredoxin [Streptomyces canus]MDT0485929.1 ferredoxin [Streptomyces sp. DSM 41640]